jgi:hypothetical protein
MSETLSAAVRLEDRFGATAPGAPTSPEQTTRAGPSIPTKSSTRGTPLGPSEGARLRELVEQIRLSVVEATMVRDLPRKVELWESYRLARAEALALLSSAAETPGTGPRRSV